MIRISFIIPAYNASKTVIRTLNSISSHNLSKDDYEVIVIDDCSTDNTREIVAEYQELHSNVRLICQPKNHRQGAARNRGLKEAKGKYIMFVDADDVVEDGVKDALCMIEDTGADTVFCNYLWVYSPDKIERRQLPIENGFVTTGEDFAENYYETIVNTCPIAYLWRRDFLINKGVPFVEDRRMEDFDWIEENVYRTSMIAYSDSVIYRVLTSENINSTTHICSPETSADWAHVSYRRMLFCDRIRNESPKFASKIEFQCRCFIANVLKIRNLTKFSPKGVRLLYERIGNDAIDYFVNMGVWKGETAICMKFPQLLIIFDCVMYPAACIGRAVVRKIRKIK